MLILYWILHFHQNSVLFISDFVSMIVTFPVFNDPIMQHKFVLMKEVIINIYHYLYLSHLCLAQMKISSEKYFYEKYDFAKVAICHLSF